MTDLIARLQKVSTGGGSMPNAQIKDLCSDAAAEIGELRKALMRHIQEGNRCLITGADCGVR
jgi:hypothetical protein